MKSIEVKKAILEAALLCVAKNDVRYYLNGVLLDFANTGELVIVATNGHYLFAAKEAIESTLFDKVIIPSESLKQALKACGKHQETIVLKNDGATWILGNTIFTPIDGSFPDYRRVIPDKVSGECGNFNAESVLLGQKALSKAEGRLCGTLFHNGMNAAIMLCDNASLIFVIVPLRSSDKVSEYTGFFK